jgi:hypothetical protein
MDFFASLAQKAEEEKKTRKSKIYSELGHSGVPIDSPMLPKSKIKAPAVPGGLWKTTVEHEAAMADLYDLGKTNNARDLYYDKNSHAGTLGNIYKDGSK